jgi:hypothetical protein
MSRVFVFNLLVHYDQSIIFLIVNIYSLCLSLMFDAELHLMSMSIMSSQCVMFSIY